MNVLRIAKTCTAALMAVAVCAGLGAAQSLSDEGTWTIQTGRSSDTVNLELHIDADGDHSSWGSDEPYAALRQISRAELFSSGADVSFDVVRDAGTLHCRGHVAHGSGGGTFQYAANTGFARELAARGIGAPSADEQRRMTYSNVSLAFVDTLRRFHYPTPSAEDLIRMADHGVTAEYVAALEADGYHVESNSALVRMVDHGVTPTFIQSMRELGYHPSAEDLVRMVDHGVGTGIAQAMLANGYHPTVNQLIQLVDHGVTAQFVQRVRAHGYKPDIEQLIRLQDAGI